MRECPPPYLINTSWNNRNNSWNTWNKAIIHKEDIITQIGSKNQPACSFNSPMDARGAFKGWQRRPRDVAGPGGRKVTAANEKRKSLADVDELISEQTKRERNARAQEVHTPLFAKPDWIGSIRPRSAIFGLISRRNIKDYTLFYRY